MELKKAIRKQVKLRLNISAPSGAGKTMSALRMAKGLVGNWDKIAVIDTENGSASLYSHLGPFNVIDLAPPFTPERYVQAINACISAGMEAIIIDSTTHEWNCILEENEKLAQARFKGNTWSAWSVTTPRHDKFVEAVLHCPTHVITCTRSKMETVMGDDKKVKKVGMKDLQREGWEYELTVSLNIERDTHMAMPSKDRTGLFEGLQPFLITEETGERIKQWCESGEMLPEPVVTPQPANAPAPQAVNTPQPIAPALTQEQLDKALASDEKGITSTLSVIEKGKLIALPAQKKQLEDKLAELKPKK